MSCLHKIQKKHPNSAVIKYWVPKLGLLVGKTEMGLGLIFREQHLGPWFNRVLCGVVAEVKIFLMEYHIFLKYKKTQFFCLVLYHAKWRCTLLKQCVHVSLTTINLISCLLVTAAVSISQELHKHSCPTRLLGLMMSFSISSVVGEVKAMRLSDLCQWIGGRVEIRTRVCATRVHYFPLTYWENG